MVKRKKYLTAFLGMSVIVSGCFFMNIPAYLHAEKNEDNKEPMRGQSYSDQSGLFLSMDEDGNVKYVKPELADVKENIVLPEDKDKDTTFDVVKETGNEKAKIASFDSLDEATDEADDLEHMQKRARSAVTSDISVYTNDMLRATTAPSIVRFINNGNTISYTEVGTNISGYTAANYAADAAYIGTESNGKIRFMMAGVTGLVDKSKVEIIPYSSSLNLSYYKASGGYLYHYISTNVKGSSYSSAQCVGKTPSGLKENTKYFSYDGHYFYTSFTTMSNDYKNNTNKNAVNASKAFYNYYQFLSHRTTTSFTTAQMDAMIKAGIGSGKSVMGGTGKYFTQYQNTYGVNALMMLGVAINESAWGKSNIALDKNNMFGHNAVDSNPYWGADGYPSSHYGIMEHAESWVSKGYAFPYDWRYYGPHLGDKQSGMNVQYASDPYWGEKAAAQAYSLEKRVGKTDTTKYTVGINTGESPVYVYSKIGDSDGAALYRTGNTNGKVIHEFPYVILDTVTSNGTKWYKIQTDGALNSSRSKLDKNSPYKFSNAYGYIKASSAIKVVNVGKDNGDGGTDNEPPVQNVPCTTVIKNAGYKTTSSYIYGINVGANMSTVANNLKKVSGVSSVTLKDDNGKTITSGKASTGMSVTIKTTSETKTFTVVIKGDVDGDGEIRSIDYSLVKNDILSIKKLTGAYALAADVDNDGSIRSIDYSLIKNDILNIKDIKQ